MEHTPFHNLEEGYATLVSSSEPWKSTILGLPEHLPELALRLLLVNKARGVTLTNSSKLKKHIQSKAPLLQKGYLEPSDFRALKLRSSVLAWAKDGSLYEDWDTTLVERSAFYKNWGDRIVGEMIQGLDDRDAILDAGICFGTTSRWVCNEQKYPNLTAAEFVRVSAVGKVTAGDRFRQVYNDLVVSLGRGGDLKDYWPETFRNQLGMKDAVWLFAKKYAACDMAKKMKVKVEKCTESLKRSDGTLFLLLKDHVIYIRIDKKRKIYRLADTNVGYLDFSQSRNPEEELYSCLDELMTLFYPDNDSVVGVQLQL